MNKKDVLQFEKLLLEERKRFIHELTQIENEGLMSNPKESSGDLSSYSYHPADQGSDTMEKEKNVFLASAKGNELYEIDQALLRIKDGKFGTCLRCGKEIERERLEAVPYAQQCFKCRRLGDEEQKRSQGV